ncbi:unnamed protein product, partial [Rotaria socialis]
SSVTNIDKATFDLLVRLLLIVPHKCLTKEDSLHTALFNNYRKDASDEPSSEEIFQLHLKFYRMCEITVDRRFLVTRIIFDQFIKINNQWVNVLLQPVIFHTFYQLLRTFKFIHLAKVLYRYLKASNIFVDLDGHVRIEAFCFARVSKRRGKCTNDSVCIRWYRASELVLCDGTYTSAMDMWSTKYDANLINKIAISNHAVMISDGFFLHDNNKQPVNMIVQFEPQKPSGNFMFDYYKKNVKVSVEIKEKTSDFVIFYEKILSYSKHLIIQKELYFGLNGLLREDKKEKLYKEYQKKIEMINKHNPDDYDKYSTASVDMDLTPLTIDTTTPKEPEKLGVASCITPDLDKLFNLYTKILDPEESDRDGLS